MKTPLRYALPCFLLVSACPAQKPQTYSLDFKEAELTKGVRLNSLNPTMVV